MIKTISLLIAMTFVIVANAQANTEADWLSINGSTSIDLGELDGQDAWQDFSEEPITLNMNNQMLTFSKEVNGNNCVANAVSNQIVVNAEESATVNIESTQTTTGSEVTAECNTINTLIRSN